MSGSYNRTDGHRADMGFEQYGGYAKLGYELSKAWNLRADVNVTHFNASNPGEVADPLTDNDQRITRGMTSLAVENNYEKSSGAVSFFYNWGRHWINDGYGARRGAAGLPFQLAGRYAGAVVVPERPALPGQPPDRGRGLLPFRRRIVEPLPRRTAGTAGRPRRSTKRPDTSISGSRRAAG